MKGKLTVIRWVLLLLLAGGIYWSRSDFKIGQGGKTPALPSAQAQSTLTKAKSSQQVRGYDQFTDVVLVKKEGNDGDSFTVRAGGEEFVLRLYFVDTPESYLSDRHESQRKRVADQGKDLGGLSLDDTVTVGLAAKLYTERELKGKKFTVYTYWERVYNDDRYYGFVELADGSYLGTRLIENGLARIHTKGPGSKESPVPTPDGKSFHQHRDKLFALERKAKAAKQGAWGL